MSSAPKAKAPVRPVKLGVIGGSGIYQMQGLKVVKEHDVETPFGRPSDKITEALMEDGAGKGRTVYFVARHGKGHRYLPTEVNYRANIHALKQLGVTHVLAVSAVGIMKESINPGDMVVPDQLYDRTKGVRPFTFFGDGVVGHVGFADPFCDQVRQVILSASKKVGATAHDGGAYVCMEGPQFSTRAESNHYRQTLSPSVIGMTAIPEAKLAREAELCYAMLALATDYDCWHETEEDVSVEAVMAVLKANADTANSIVRAVAAGLPETASCACSEAARFAIMTRPDAIPAAAKQRLKVLFGRYLDQ